MALSGEAWQARHKGYARRASVGRGTARQAWLGMVWRGVAMQGNAGMALHGPARTGSARLGRQMTTGKDPWQPGKTGYILTMPKGKKGRARNEKQKQNQARE